MKKKKMSAVLNKIRRTIEAKGFYIALFALILIMGFSIYARRMQNNIEQNDLAFDEAAWQQALEESGVEFRGMTASEADAPTDAEPTATETVTDPAKDLAAESDSTAAKASKPVTTAKALPEPEEETVTASAQVTVAEDPEKMQMPCIGEVIDQCSLSELVYCTAMGDWRTHNGLDIAASEGTPVIAAASGTVAQVFEDEMMGVVVTLDHGSGITSLYGNLQSVDFISTGTQVQKGDIIGGIGKPGVLEADKGPHLHFEVYKDGELRDPTSFIVN